MAWPSSCLDTRFQKRASKVISSRCGSFLRTMSGNCHSVTSIELCCSFTESGCKGRNINPMSWWSVCQIILKSHLKLPNEKNLIFVFYTRKVKSWEIGALSSNHRVNMGCSSDSNQILLTFLYFQSSESSEVECLRTWYMESDCLNANFSSTF